MHAWDMREVAWGGARERRRLAEAGTCGCARPRGAGGPARAQRELPACAVVQPDAAARHSGQVAAAVGGGGAARTGEDSEEIHDVERRDDKGAAVGTADEADAILDREYHDGKSLKAVARGTSSGVRERRGESGEAPERSSMQNCHSQATWPMGAAAAVR